MRFAVIPIFRGVRGLSSATLALSLAAAPVCAASVFDAPDSPYETPLTETSGAAPEQGEVILRWLSVEERSGCERHGALVRVPVFFAEHECRTLDELAILPADGGPDAAAIVYQADDIRHGPDGGISRVHLWFEANLNAGEKQRFKLVRRRGAIPRAKPLPIETDGESVRFVTTNGKIEFGRDGGLRTVALGGASWEFGGTGAFPRVVVVAPGPQGGAPVEVAMDASDSSRQVEWGSGPLFAKLRIRLSRPGDIALEQDYRIPRDGSEFVITATIHPGVSPDAGIRRNELLAGKLGGAAAGGSKVTEIPAGVRYALRAEHAYRVTTLSSGNVPGALLAVPLVLGGGNGQWRMDQDGEAVLQGLRGLRRGDEGEKGTLRAFWTEVRLVPALAGDEVSWWKIYRQHVQPLVAVVDEPGVTVDQLHEALAKVVREMKPIGWRQDAARALVLGNDAQAAKILRGVSVAKEGNVEGLVRGARNATAKLSNNGARKLREDEKGRGYGGLDPYHVTYTQSAAAAIAVLHDAPPSISAVNLAMTKGVREFGGRVDATGFPYLDCYSRTLNMQLGPVLFGLTAGAAAGDDALVRFYRDLATAPAVLGVFGRGQRPYTGAATTAPEQTDFLYQSICDFWLRTAELLGKENLSLHPLAFSRYTDCIDVMADRYHAVGPHDKPDNVEFARANFFRGQTHTHRWLGWSAAPFIRLLEEPIQRGGVGVTEATRYAQAQLGRWKNWPDLTFYVLADLLVREALPRAVPVSLPNSPGAVRVTRTSGGADLVWDAVPGATAYRVFRAEHAGGPWRWLNSPYVAQPAPTLTATHFTDDAAPANAVYVVTAVDAAGRESAWAEKP